MHACEDCPGEKSVLDLLWLACRDEERESASDDAGIRYKRWESADRCTLREIVATQECLLKLCQQIWQLTRHHFEAKVQSAHFVRLKQNVEDGEVVVQGDFADNFSFTVQDAAQSFRWDAPQCTVHPFVCYWRQDGEQRHQSCCVIPDSTKHNAAAVLAFLRCPVPAIKELVPGLRQSTTLAIVAPGNIKSSLTLRTSVITSKTSMLPASELFCYLTW